MDEQVVDKNDRISVDEIELLMVDWTIVSVDDFDCNRQSLDAKDSNDMIVN